MCIKYSSILVKTQFKLFPNFSPYSLTYGTEHYICIRLFFCFLLSFEIYLMQIIQFVHIKTIRFFDRPNHYCFQSKIYKNMKVFYSSMLLSTMHNLIPSVNCMEDRKLFFIEITIQYIKNKNEMAPVCIWEYKIVYQVFRQI